MQSIESVPTNIITGALGAGKTTLITSLLSQKPKGERWAILLNEFGEVGIDGALLADESDGQIFVREVPGGCMCCTSGLPMQIALNQLLAKARPHRLLIEPTGLGHPTEVLQTLREPHYQRVLNVRATLTLIDARKLRSKQWREHSTFQEQLKIADTIVMTKSAHYTVQDRHQLQKYFQQLNLGKIPILDSELNSVDFDILNRDCGVALPDSSHHHKAHTSPYARKRHESTELPPIVKVSNQGQGFFSYGWLCAPQKVFDFKQLKSVFMAHSVERLKAVMITKEGSYSFNISDDVLTVRRVKQAKDSRIEFIVDEQPKANAIATFIENRLALTDDCPSS